MRARGIKPGFYKNECLAELPFAARLLYTGLWCMADREGRLEDRPKRIKAEVFPYDNVNINNLLGQLADKRFIHRYAVDGANYICIPKFHCHQNPHKQERPSIIPAPGDIEKLLDNFGTTSEVVGLTPSSLTPDSGLLTPDSKEGPRAPVDNELVDELLDIAADVRSSVAQWHPGKADRATFSALILRFPPQQIRDELGKFAAYAPQRDYRLFGKTFASWMGRVSPLPMTVPRPTARAQRIANARSQLEQGNEDTARVMCQPDEWDELLADFGGT